MKLKHSTIPQEFLSNIPRGMKYVMRNGKDFLVVEQVFCPAGHSLMVDNVRLHGEPSICMTLRVGGAEGAVDPGLVLGQPRQALQFHPQSHGRGPGEEQRPVPLVRLSLVTRMKKGCKTCGSNHIIVMHLPGAQNKIMACAGLGCPWHRIVAEEVSHKYTEMVDDINYFGL